MHYSYKKIVMKKFVLILCVISLSGILNAKEILYKSCKDNVQLYGQNTDNVTSLKMYKNDVVWILGKKDGYVYIKYAIKTGPIFRIKIEDIKECDIDLNSIQEYAQ
jgi:hypothetical protein